MDNWSGTDLTLSQVAISLAELDCSDNPETVLVREAEYRDFFYLVQEVTSGPRRARRFLRAARRGWVLAEVRSQRVWGQLLKIALDPHTELPEVRRAIVETQQQVATFWLGDPIDSKVRLGVAALQGDPTAQDRLAELARNGGLISAGIPGLQLANERARRRGAVTIAALGTWVLSLLSFPAVLQMDDVDTLTIFIYFACTGYFSYVFAKPIVEILEDDRKLIERVNEALRPRRLPSASAEPRPFR
jgi:hypothetical protein